jgi:hypothetical protein
VTLKERIEKLVADGAKTQSELNMADVSANLAGILAELEKPDLTIDIDVFEAMDQSLRLACLQGMLVIYGFTLGGAK